MKSKPGPLLITWRHRKDIFMSSPGKTAKLPQFLHWEWGWMQLGADAVFVYPNPMLCRCAPLLHPSPSLLPLATLFQEKRQNGQPINPNINISKKWYWTSFLKIWMLLSTSSGQILSASLGLGYWSVIAMSIFLGLSHNPWVGEGYNIIQKYR